MPITPDLPFPKSAGDAIRSKDWNDLVTETQRLDNAKLNLTGGAITGPLTIAGALGVANMQATGSVVVNLRATVGPVKSEPQASVVGRIEVSGASASLDFIRRELTAWPDTPAPGDRFIWYNSGSIARLWTDVKGDLLAVEAGTGQVGIGTSTPDYQLDVAGRMRVRQDSAGFTAGIWFSGYGLSDRSFVGLFNDNFVGFWGSAGSDWMLLVNTTSGDLSIKGNAFKPGGGAWALSSDIRLKKNVQPLQGALDKLLKLRGMFYEWKEPEKHGDLTGPQVGFIGQEVEKVFPEWIGEDSNGYRTLSIRGFEAMSVEAFRELKAECRSLTQQLETLRADLENRTGSLAFAAGQSR